MKCRWSIVRTALLQRVGFGLALLLALGFGAEPAWAETIAVRTAQAQLFPEGAASVEQVVKLSHRWDAQFPGIGGRAIYRFDLPAATGTEPFALLFSRIGNQVVLRVNGELVWRAGELRDPRQDSAKTPHMVTLPAALLSSAKPNQVEVEVTTQASRWGGLSTVRYGPEREILQRYSTLRAWRHASSIIFAATLAVMGALAFALWTLEREKLYAVFALAALAGLVRHVDRIWPDVPVSWPLWGGIAALAYAWHITLMAVFSNQVITRAMDAMDARDASDAVSLRVQRLCLWVGAATSVLAVVAFAALKPVYWTAGMALLGLPTAVVLWRVGVAAYRDRDFASVLLFLAALAALLAGVHDFGGVRLALFTRQDATADSAFSILPHAMFFFVVMMGAVVVQRYAGSLRNYRELSSGLAERIAAREAELSKTNAALSAQQAEQATLRERARIMRDIHDGVGAQLVGLLNLLKRKDTAHALLEDHVNTALDELRMAIDSLQPVHGDLSSVLATLRYRLQPRLEAAGLRIDWRVESLPPVQNLNPTAVLQVQRILLEAFTNILKHSGATEITVEARHDEPRGVMLLRVADNGRGLASAQNQAGSAGHGLTNMRTRAAQIGVALAVTELPNGGTQVSLEWPSAEEK
jgi:signal transduction histidine kinase